MATMLNPNAIPDGSITQEKIDSSVLAAKQDTLTPGNGISIKGGVISSSVAEVVDSIVNAGYVFAGVATPATDPGTPNAKVFYIANGKGTYTNFGSLEVTEDEVIVLKYDTAWHKVSTGIASQEKLTELDEKIGKPDEPVDLSNSAWKSGMITMSGSEYVWQVSSSNPQNYQHICIEVKEGQIFEVKASKYAARLYQCETYNPKHLQSVNTEQIEISSNTESTITIDQGKKYLIITIVTDGTNICPISVTRKGKSIIPDITDVIDESADNRHVPTSKAVKDYADTSRDSVKEYIDKSIQELKGTPDEDIDVSSSNFKNGTIVAYPSSSTGFVWQLSSSETKCKHIVVSVQEGDVINFVSGTIGARYYYINEYNPVHLSEVSLIGETYNVAGNTEKTITIDNPSVKFVIFIALESEGGNLCPLSIKKKGEKAILLPYTNNINTAKDDEHVPTSKAVADYVTNIGRGFIYYDTIPTEYGDNFNIRFMFRPKVAFVNNCDNWVAGKSYSIGDYCKNGTTLYRCINAHTSTSSFALGNFVKVSVIRFQGASVDILPSKLVQVTETFTDNGETKTSYYGTFRGGLRYETATNLGTRKYKQFIGGFAFSVRYIADDWENHTASISNTGSSIVLKVDNNVVSTLPFATYTTMNALYNAVNAVDGFICDYREIEGRTPYELAVFDDAQLVSQFKGSINGKTVSASNPAVVYTDNPPLLIPYAMQKEWNTAEVVGTPDNIYVCINGMSKAYSRNANVDAIPILGDDFDFKGIEISAYTMRDAEIAENYTASSIDKTIVISSFSPFCIVFEGHGIIDSPTDSVSDRSGDKAYACTIDRLQGLFEYALSKGYVPISLEDTIMHYKNGKVIPKRCFTIIFDDYRFNNFLNLKFRSVFETYGIKANLAVVSSMGNPLAYNGKSITLEEAIRIGKNAGFEFYTHTRGEAGNGNYQRNMLTSKPSLYANEYMLDVYDADEKGVNPSVVIFPDGSCNAYLCDTLKWVGCKGAIAVDTKNPNCNNEYQIVRVDVRIGAVGNEKSIEVIKSYIL